jgi:hypothetical protein
MNKLLALLILSPLAYAEKYHFTCENKNLKETNTSLVIDTDKKYIEFGNVLIVDEFTETASEINGSYSYKDENKILVFKTYYSFNKITGIFNTVNTSESAKFFQEYLCIKVIPLIP